MARAAQQWQVDTVTVYLRYVLARPAGSETVKSLSVGLAPRALSRVISPTKFSAQCCIG